VMDVLARVIVKGETPTTRKAFAVLQSGVVRKGMYVVVEGRIVGQVLEVYNLNKFFDDDFLFEVEALEKHVPLSEGNEVVFEIGLLGELKAGQVQRVTFPPRVFAEVTLPNAQQLQTFLGFDDKGLALGHLLHHDVVVKLSLTKLLQKHLAVLAMSGAGKSYFTTTLIEELMAVESGRVAVILFDVHGEYRGFTKGVFKDRVKVFMSEDVQIPIEELSVEDFTHIVPSLNSEQQRIALHVLLNEAKERARQRGVKLTVDFLIDVLKTMDSQRIHSATRESLARALEFMRTNKVFGTTLYPALEEVMEPGGLVVFDFSDGENLDKKRIIVRKVLSTAYELRKRGVVPPFLAVIEEAHNFASEGGRQDVSKRVIELIAREGRKFGASLCIISQRPAHLSKTALSQCNTHVLLRITNPTDLDQIKVASEGVSEQILKDLPLFRPGEAVIVGEAVNFPLFIKVREPETRRLFTFPSLHDMAAQFEQQFQQQRQRHMSDVQDVFE